MSGEDQQPGRPNVEPPAPGPEDGVAGRSTFRSAARFVGGSVGCLIFLVVLVFVAFGVLAIFLDDPALWLAGLALLVALSARKAAKEVRKR